MELNKTLERQAKRLNACADGRNSLLALNDKNDMVRLYLHHIDFCLMNDYPSNEFIRENFVGVMERYGVHLDDDVELDDMKKIVALGKTMIRANYKGYAVGEMFVKHDSSANIVAHGNAFVMVDAFDHAVVHIYAHDRARVCVNVYGDAHVDVVKQDDGAHVRIVNKNKKTY